MTAPPLATTDDRPAISVGGRRIPVVLPRRGDPRLRVAAVLITVQVLGQTVLGFKLSIAQILVTIGLTGLVETALVLRRQGALVWPASALLTGNSVALLLRTTGTRHGDWWSLNGIHWFILAALLALGSKHVVRADGRHVFNPSNLGLVAVLLLVGAEHVFPQPLYWGPPDSPAVLFTVLVLVLGGSWVLRRLGLLPMVAAFVVPFAAAVAVLAVGGGEFFALWAVEPVSGWSYWAAIVLSPETMVFMFFMMPDPGTVPSSRTGRVLFGSVTALVAIALLAPQQTEYGVKLAILASLIVSCALTSLLERAASALGDPLPIRPRQARPTRRRDHARLAALLAVTVLSLGAVAQTLDLADDGELILIERGLARGPDAQ